MMSEQPWFAIMVLAYDQAGSAGPARDASKTQGRRLGLYFVQCILFVRVMRYYLRPSCVTAVLDIYAFILVYLSK